MGLILDSSVLIAAEPKGSNARQALTATFTWLTQTVSNVGSELINYAPLSGLGFMRLSGEPRRNRSRLQDDPQPSMQHEGEIGSLNLAN
jgi:hypothetical protein